MKGLEIIIKDWVNFDWVEPSYFKKTVANIEIKIGENVLSEYKSNKDGNYSRSLTLPLFEVAEWLLHNYWNILFEYSERRNSKYMLSQSTSAYALPNISFSRIGNQILVKSLRYNDGIREFLNQGEYYVEFESFRDSMLSFSESVIKRIPDTENIKHKLSNLYDYCQIQSPDNEIYIYTSMLGLNPYEISDEQENEIIFAYQQIPMGIKEEIFAKCNFQELKEFLNQFNAISNEKLKDFSTIPLLYEEKRNLFKEPWTFGYEFANYYRSNVAKEFMERIIHEPDSFMSYNHIDNFAYNFSLDSKDGRMSLYLKKQHPANKPFNISRLIFLNNINKSANSITTDSSTWNQKASKCFAAELLLPVEKLTEIVKTNSISEEDVYDIAEGNNLSYYVVKHQIENRLKIPIYEG